MSGRFPLTLVHWFIYSIEPVLIGLADIVGHDSRLLAIVFLLANHSFTT